MSNSNYVHPLFSSLMNHGKTLAALLRSAKNKQNSSPGSIHEKVEDIITKLLEEINRAQDSSFPEEALANVLEKIEGTLRTFIKVDPDSASIYEDLSKRVNDSTKPQRSSHPEVSPVSLSSPGDDDPSNHQASVAIYLLEEFNFEAAYAGLNDIEKQCLFCFSLFSAGVEIKKRHLVHWWVGMGLVDPSLGEDEVIVDELLDKFVAEGFIEHFIKNKMISNRYTMRDFVHSKVQKAMEACRQYGYHKLEAQKGALSMIKRHRAAEVGKIRQSISFVLTFTLSITQEDDKMVVEVADKIEALINISKFMLNARTFDLLSKMKNVKVLHLGSWHQSTNQDIVIDDAELLKHLKNLEQLRFLNLQGISGIVQLSDSVCKLKNLKVLDLRACHNLEFLPQGMDALQQLTYLDLSECYLLDHIPKEITSLSKLKVLKGFVVNPDPDPETDPQIGMSANGSLENATFCVFRDLSKLKSLRKLTMRTRRMSFPTTQDLETLYEMQQLRNLRIKWVGSNRDTALIVDGYSSRFPESLTKLELQAAPESIALTLLGLISKQNDNGLKKLYIKGGGLSLLVPCKFHVKEVRLRYLPNLKVNWHEFLRSFPYLIRLEIFECPNLMFPCDENGVWEGCI